MSAQDFTRSSELYFDDGNVVIEAEGTVFRLHRGFLVRNSSVFADMFAMPQPVADASDSYDGCALVHVTDAARDMEAFLRAFHDANFYLPDARDEFATAIAVLRLSNKYDIPFLYSRAIHHLSSYLPATVEEYDGLSQSAGPIPLSTIDVGSLASAIREAGVLRLLPALFYGCCRDGKEAILRTSLLPSDKDTCISAISLIFAELARTLGILLAPENPASCENRSSCIVKWVSVWLRSSIWRYQRSDFLRHPQSDETYLRNSMGMCAHCARIWHHDFRALRETIWERLPQMFGLPPWEELRAGAS